MDKSEAKMASATPHSDDSAMVPADLPETPEVLSNVQLSLVILGSVYVTFIIYYTFESFYTNTRSHNTRLWLSLFLCSLETTIVSTSLIHIANDLQDLSNAGWIVVAYLLTFNGNVVI